MEVGFDKEIDAILRTARTDEAATSLDSHPDADEISAFAENALPENLRRKYTVHFADCTRCRRILSNTILLNSEAETETASSVVPAKIVEPVTPWYRKLFVFPQITYAMGTLVVLFSGFFGYLFLQNQSSKNAEVSYSVDKSQEMPKSASVSNANTSVFSSANTNSNMAMTNSTATTTTTNSATLAQPSANISATPSERKSDAPTLSKSEPVQSMPKPEATSLPKSEVAEVNKDLDRVQSENEAVKPTDGAIQEDRKIAEKKIENLPLNGRNNNNYQLDGQSTADSTMMTKTERSAPAPAKKKSSEAGATRTVGGKIFNNIGGIWFDTAYTKQKQKTYKRGTSDYLGLDAGLRSIADNLGGTVVIVWNGKAYRIQ